MGGIMDNERISDLQKEIRKLRSQWPAHSVPAAMILRLDELEEELEELQNPTTSERSANDE